MKKINIIIKKTAICFLSFFSTSLFSVIDWHHRPESIKSEVNEAFQRLDHEYLEWLYTSSKHYMYFKEKNFIKKIILLNPTRKDFYVMDYGAGCFSWGDVTAKFLNEQSDLPKDIRVHIVSLIGEQSNKPEITRDGICIHYKLGRFKLEEIEQQLQERMPSEIGNLTAKFDFIITTFTLRHLIDPVGSFSQLYNLLSPNSGVMLFDFFVTVINKELMNQRSILPHLIIELDTKVLFNFTEINRNSCYALCRTNEKKCEIPLEYESIEFLEDRYQRPFGEISAYKGTLPEMDDNIILEDFLIEDNFLYGSQSLLDFLEISKNKYKSAPWVSKSLI